MPLRRRPVLRVTTVCAPSASQAEPSAAVTLPGARVFPESVTSTSDGTIFVGPNGVAEAAGTAWISEGQLSDLFGGTAPTLPFDLQRVPLLAH